MQGNMLYFKYLNENSKYFSPPTQTLTTDNDFLVHNLPFDWNLHEDKNTSWKFYTPNNHKLPEQGWKIHISCTINEAAEILERVSILLIRNNVPFKHIKNRGTLLNMNSKNANRASSGKFMAIYPVSNEEFLYLIGMLHQVVQSFEPGPYILSDKRWKDTNVYYRYGGFSNIYNEKGELCIRDLDGQLILDERVPFYQVPEFVKEFDEKLEFLNKNYTEDSKDSNFERYKFTNALTFSNAGGVYVAERKVDNLKVIIKEARPQAGLDAESYDAVKRQSIEKHALETLSSVKGVVNLIDSFKSWDHYFIVEEYVEGESLHSWITKNYPFIDNGSIDKYKNKVLKIITKLAEILEGVHLKGISMGDLQPANIMISEECDVTLIDFETAKNIHSTDKPGMLTTAYAHSKIEKSGARDWYALRKIVQFCLLPISYAQDLDEYMVSYHYRKIRELYGKEFFKHVEQICKTCTSYLIKYDEQFTFNDVFKEKNVDNLSDIINRLTKGISENFINDRRLIEGDIRQFEHVGGGLNFLNGGAGVALMFERQKLSHKAIDKWLHEYLIQDEAKSLENEGLFTGRTGVSILLHELGYSDEARDVFQLVTKSSNNSDISLRSGLAGIGLAAVSLYFDTGEAYYLNKAELIIKLIDIYLNENNEEMNVEDWSAVPIGMIDGFSGVSLLYSALYSVTKKEHYIKKSKELIEKDLSKTLVAEEQKVLQTIDKHNRLLPYLSGGSVGVAVAIWFSNHVSGRADYEQEFELITNLYKTRSTLIGGFFEGAGGLLLIPSLLGEEHPKFDESKDKLLDLLSLFLIEEEDYFLFPGHFNFKLSHDVYSGSTGIILALLSIEKNNPLYWLPIANPDQFISKTKF